MTIATKFEESALIFGDCDTSALKAFAQRSDRAVENKVTLWFPFCSIAIGIPKISFISFFTEQVEKSTTVTATIENKCRNKDFILFGKRLFIVAKICLMFASAKKNST